MEFYQQKVLAVTLVFVDSTQGWLVTDSWFTIRSTNQSIYDCNMVELNQQHLDGNFKIHKFTGPGTFHSLFKNCYSCAADNLVSYLVVGSGGAAGATNGGGGGAGGFRELVSPSSPYTGSPLNGYPTPGNRNYSYSNIFIQL